MANQDLHRAVGLLMTGRVEGPVLSDSLAAAIRAGTVSGITLFKNNGVDLRQLAQLVDDLHRHSGRQDFLVSVDQEGGAVQRFEQIIAPMPAPMALAALNEHERIVAIASIQAKHLLALGINCNLVPTLDVNSNPANPIIATRSFGDDPALIAQLGRIVAKTYLDHGVLPVGKHFPGHGDTAEDSHLQLATVSADETTLWVRELAPFINCADQLPAMLIAHVWLKAIDAEPLPSSLSHKVVTKLLREELGYEGFLMTDDMPGMKAIAGHWGLEEAAILSINAGIDHLLMCGTVEQVESVHSALVAAVQKGIISESRLSSAVKRRQRALADCGRTFLPAEDGGWPFGKSLEQRIEEIEESLEASREISARTNAEAAALVRGYLPDVTRGELPWVLIVPDHWRYRMNLLGAIADLSEGLNISIHERRYSLDPQSDEIADTVNFASQKNCIFLTYRALVNEGQIRLSQALAARVSPQSLLVVSDVPYEVEKLQEWPNALALFDASDEGMKGLALLLTNRCKPVGRSPVELTV